LITVPVPFLDTACPSRWLASLDRLAKADYDLVVPGHGAPMHRAEVEAYRTALRNFVGCAGTAAKSVSDCSAGWKTDARALLGNEDPKWLDGMLGYYIELLRGDPKRIEKLCAE
ncbi:MAG TPA: hypothetical protein VN605_05380, partial [Thermoanaerobaculia bacterium]|nr:hypothetical protein [Thermoanaerobaculia bacterium]